MYLNLILCFFVKNDFFLWVSGLYIWINFYIVYELDIFNNFFCRFYFNVYVSVWNKRWGFLYFFL